MMTDVMSTSLLPISKGYRKIDGYACPYGLEIHTFSSLSGAVEWCSNDISCSLVQNNCNDNRQFKTCGYNSLQKMRTSECGDVLYRKSKSKTRFWCWLEKIHNQNSSLCMFMISIFTIIRKCY